MSRKEINIGVEGNDGTGDSIRDSFKKVNDNFQELYAVLGQEGALSFIGLDDTPGQYLTTDTNKVLVVDGDNERLLFKELRGDATIVINQTIPGVISFSSLASALINDGNPTLAANLNANFKRITNLSEGSVDTDAATKGYVDGKLSLAGVDAVNPETGATSPSWGTMTGPLVLSRNPVDSDDVNYGGLVASTKSYVDSKTFSSITNIYVTTNGQDYRTDIPESAKGRFWSTAFRSVQRACELAEELVNDAPIELGPYQKILTFNNGTENCTLFDIIESPLSGAGALAEARLGLDPDTLISIIQGGTGYEIGDTLGISGGTAIVPALLRVVAKDFAGSITQVAIEQQGVYSLLPDDLDNIGLVGGSGSGTASISARFTVTSIIVTDSGSGYGSGASVIVTSSGTGGGTEAYVTEIGGEIKEVTIARGGSGYDVIPTVEIFLPRLLLETDNKGSDFDDDLREGQCLRGLNSRAVAKIISHNGSRDSFGREIFDIELISGVFENDEIIEYGEPVKDIQITIEIESGVYYENFPLRIPPNVSLRGSEFRRAIIRPKQGVSQSPWARLYFRRDQIIDGLRAAKYEYGYHYLTDPLDYSSRPLDNNEMDVFLCGDATIVRNLTVQGHGGFMMVLDPNSQIGSKSPYCQTGTSFSRSINEKQFAGGQFVDGFSGNLEGILLGRVGTSTEKIIIGGLVREPQLPNSFVLGGELYRITLVNKIETEYFGAKVLLEQNRAFIQSETIAWINGEFLDLEYDEAKCYRDVGLIVDAVVQDVLYGGYINSTQAGRLYFNNGATVVSGQVSQTADAIAKAKEIATYVINQDLWPAVGTVVQTTIPSITDGGLAETVLGNCFDVIEVIVRYGEKIYKAKSLLQSNKELIQSEVIEYINTVYPSLNYDEALCKRDTGFIVDAVSIDLFGDFNNSLRAGHAHFRQAGRVFPADQVDETIDAIEYGKYLMTQVVNNDPPSVLRTSKIFNPINDVSLVTNSISIPGHSFTNGSRVVYTAEGGTPMSATEGPLTDGGTYYIYVLDGNTVQLYRSLELVIAREKEVNTSIEINITSIGTGTGHKLAFQQATDIDLEAQDLLDANITDNIDTAISYIQTLVQDGNTADVPGIYPQYECVLDTPFYGATAAAYDETYCSRDVGLIVNAVLYDMVLGSNFQSINAGRAYLRSYAVDVTTNQLTATLNAIIKAEEEAKKLLNPGTYSAARNTISDRMLLIRDIIENGTASVPAITYPTPTGMSGTDNKVKAKDILIANKAFIQAEIIAWIDVQKAGNIAPFTSSDVIDGAACSRDVGYIIDAMCYDILYSGNSLTKNAAEAYYSALATGGTVILGQEAKTAAALARLKTVLGYVVVNDNTSWTKSVGNLLNQNVALPAASASETTRTNTLTDVLIDYVADGDYDTATATVNPTITGQSATLQGARNLVVAEISNIQATVVDFVSNGRGKIIIGTAGNKSMLGNDFTQVNDMGYGIFAMNNGLIESVSMFTYYCYTAMYALNGAQIRALNGSSAHGFYGLKAEGADPNEVPDIVSLKFPLIQTATAYTNPGLDLTNAEGELTLYVSNYQYVPRSGSFVDIDHTGDPGGNTRLGLKTYVINTASTQDLPDGVCSLGLGLVTGQTGLAIDIPNGKPVIIRQNEELVIAGKEEIVATRPSTALIFNEDRTNTIRVLSFTQYEGLDAVTADVIVGSKDGYNYVNLPVLEGSTSYTVPAWSGNTGDDQIAVQTLSFVDSQRVVYPITGAAIYDGSTTGTGGHIFGYQDSVYEITGYDVNSADPNNPIGVLTFRNLTNPLAVTRTATVSAATNANPCVITTSTDQYLNAGRRVKFTGVTGMTQLNGNTYYVNPLTYSITATATVASTDNITVSSTAGLAAGQRIVFSGVVFGGIVASETYIIHTVGAGTIKITATTGGTVYGLSDASGSMAVVVTSDTNFALYTDSALTMPLDGTGFGVFSGGTSSLQVLGGLTYSVNASNGNLTLNSGIRAGAVGDITVNISTMRATGHDFLDIGTGSYADTNYPNNIFGPPANSPDKENQVIEKGKGRVFFVSTDQSGNFRVGDFFAVDQGTGQVTLDASINLRGIDSLRLRQGQEISEFSNDTSLGGSGLPDSQAVPTENATRTYIDRRLGLSHFGVRVTDGLIGPGYLALNGELSMKGNLDMDDNRVLNLPQPRQGIAGGEEAVPRFFMKMANLEDGPSGWRPETGSPTYGVTDADILVFTGSSANFTNATVGGYLTFTRSGTTINATINDNTIVDADINYDAAIGQHKLALNTAKATTADGYSVTAYTANTTVSTTITAAGHGFSNNNVVVISGETTVTAINGDWKISNVTTDTFDIPANTSGGGVISGSAKVRLYGMLSGAKDIEFTIVNGFLALKDATSTTTGIARSKLAHIDPSVYDATDQTSLSGTVTKVLGRRGVPTTGTPTGAVVPIDARTIVEDADGLSRAEVPSIGVVVRSSTGTGSGKFTTVTYGSSNANNTIVQRGPSGEIAIGGLTTTGVTSSGSITLTGGINAGDGVNFTVNSTTTSSLTRVLDDGATGSYYTLVRNGNGGSGIRLNDGSTSARQYTSYIAREHRFTDTGGLTNGVIDVKGGTLASTTTGGVLTNGYISGYWNVNAGSRMSATWADLAEWYASDKEYEPGTVVMFGGESEITLCNEAATTRVAGVVTTNPAFVLNSEQQGTRTCVALQGRVPTKVVGKVKKGDLIVASGIAGVAISAGTVASPGTIIGKALEDYDSDRIGTIEIVVGRV